MSRNSGFSLIWNNFLNFTSSYPGMVFVSLVTVRLLTEGTQKEEEYNTQLRKPNEKNNGGTQNKSGEKLLNFMYRNPASFFSMVCKVRNLNQKGLKENVENKRRNGL